MQPLAAPPALGSIRLNRLTEEVECSFDLSEGAVNRHVKVSEVGPWRWAVSRRTPGSLRRASRWSPVDQVCCHDGNGEDRRHDEAFPNTLIFLPAFIEDSRVLPAVERVRGRWPMVPLVDDRSQGGRADEAGELHQVGYKYAMRRGCDSRRRSTLTVNRRQLLEGVPAPVPRGTAHRFIGAVRASPAGETRLECYSERAGSFVRRVLGTCVCGRGTRVTSEFQVMTRRILASFALTPSPSTGLAAGPPPRVEAQIGRFA